MELERLAEFAAIAQCGSLKKAALMLDLSAATLSARLIRFEEHLGVALFHRTGGALTLTEDGKHLLPQALEILSQYSQIRTSMAQAQEHAYHKLRIAVTGTSLPLHLGPFLDQLILKYPQMQLDILDDSRYSIGQGLTSDQVDIYFSPGCNDHVPPNCVRQFIARPGEYVLLPRSHRLADRSMISIRELEGESFILYPRTEENAIREFQLKNLRSALSSYSVYDSDSAVLFCRLLVPIGKGIFLYPHMIDLPPNSVCIPVSDLPHPASICFYYAKNNPNPDVQAFVKDYLAFAKEMTRYEHRKNL